jgi:hypothetical protein
MDLKKILEKYFKEQLSDEALTEITTLFESGVNEAVKAKLEEKENALEESNKADMEAFKSELVDKLSEYVNLAVGEFIEENQKGLEDGVKVKIAENVMSGLMNVLKDQHVQIPEGETDVVKDLEEKLATTEGKLNDSINAGIEDKAQVLEYEKALSFKKLTGQAELSEMDSEKVLDLLDGIEADDIETFEEKTQIMIDKVKEDAGNDDDGDPGDGSNHEDLNEKVNDDGSDDSPIDQYVP